MSKTNLLLKFSSMMLAVSMLIGTPAIIHAAQGTTGGTMTQAAAAKTWYPARPAANMGSIVLTNFNGNGGALTFDLERGTLVPTKNDSNRTTNDFVVNFHNTYTAPAAVNDIPGRMQINLAPGTYRYTASVPNIGAVNGELEVAAGKITGLSFYGGEPKTVVENHSQSHGHSDMHTTKTLVFTKLLVAQEDLTAQAR